MAESIFKMNADGNDLSQDDPFAELTRIMGHDARSVVPNRPVISDAGDSLALDLENELMGDFDGFDDNVVETHGTAHVAQADPAADPADWLQDPAPMAEPLAEPDFENSLDALLGDAFAEDRKADVGPAAFMGAQEQHAEFPHDDQHFTLLDEDPAMAEEAQTPDQTVSIAAEDLQLHDHDFGEGHEEAAEAEIPFDYAKAVAGRPGSFVVAESQPADPAPYSGSWSNAGAWEHADRPEKTEEAAVEWQPEAHAANEYDQWNGMRAEAAETRSEAERAAPEPEFYGDDLPPEVETVDVPEAAVAVADHLDIPDVPYRDAVKPASDLDEIEEILAGAFGENAEPDQATDAWTDSPSGSEEQASRLLEDEFLMAGIGDGGSATAAFANRQAPAPADEWRYDDPAQLAPAPGVQPPPPSGDSRLNSRLMMTAAVLGGVAILGGVTMFALSSSGGGEPVLLAADSSPVKIRPENPGGVQIPNQENPVYRRVSGEQADVPAQQPRLVSATEEPVVLPIPDEGELGSSGEIFAGSIPEEKTAVASAAGEPGADTPTETTSGRPVASTADNADDRSSVEERLINTAEEQIDNAVVAVTPRRVRSLIVRPDGTMVPREAPQPEPQPIAADMRGAEQNPGGAAGIAATATGQTQESAQDTGDLAVPRSGPIPPSRPGNITPQQVAAAAPAVQQPSQPAAPAQQQQQQVAALEIPPEHSATAPGSASEWSVQIASQPSVEDAQKSYQNLAQRFGSMLQGKGVNIVKADIEGKGTYYRVRIPSPSKEDAIQLCSQLKSAGGSCFVSK